MSAAWFPAASAAAPRVDALMGYVLFVAVSFAALVGGFIFYFALKYHHASRADRSNPSYNSVPLEIFWTGVPLLLTLSIFVWGAKLFIAMREPPPDALEIDVVGKQWMWEVQHAEGRRELNEVHVPAGRPVKLLMTSADVIHSFFVPAFRVKQDVLPGRYTTEWFEATAPGRYRLFCAQYCGTAHSAMGGWITVLAPAAYQRWLEEGEKVPSMTQSGARLFGRLGCAGCHRASGPGPALALASGDESALRESILRPGPRMPAYEGRLDEGQLQQLTAYLKSLRRER